MTFEGMREMFEGDSADTCAGKFPLVSMGGRAEGLACADPGARTPIGASGIYQDCGFISFLFISIFNNIFRVDFFSLDIEGAEMKVLRTIPFNKVDIEIFLIEVNRI